MVVWEIVENCPRKNYAEKRARYADHMARDDTLYITDDFSMAIHSRTRRHRHRAGTGPTTAVQPLASQQFMTSPVLMC